MINELQEHWKRIGHHKRPTKKALVQELAMYKKIFELIQVGPSYYFVFTPPLNRVEHPSDTLENVTLYPKSMFNTDLFLRNIHPEDLPWFIKFEKEVVQFKSNLPSDKIMKYKSQYNYRLKRNDGKYIPILQQSVTIQCDENGAVLRNLVIHTDISSLKKDNSMALSFIGLEDEPSYENVLTNDSSSKILDTLTKRETQIVQLVLEKKSTQEIAEALSISPETVSTHRKNIHQKLGTSSVVDLMYKFKFSIVISYLLYPFLLLS